MDKLPRNYGPDARDFTFEGNETIYVLILLIVVIRVRDLPEMPGEP